MLELTSLGKPSLKYPIQVHKVTTVETCFSVCKDSSTCFQVQQVSYIEKKAVLKLVYSCYIENKYSDTSANEDNSFRNHIR